MKKVLVFTACILFLATGAALADSSYNLYLGGSYSSIASIVNGSPTTEGGGSVDVSSLNGKQLNYVYCVGLFTLVYVPGTYDNTMVNKIGQIGGVDINRASDIAWLLGHYGTGGQGDQAKALQAAIWNVEYGNSVYQLNTSAYPTSASAVATDYTNMLNALTAANLNGQTGNVSNFLWMTPGKSGENVQYQGLVAPVPIPGAFWLLGSGLAGLIGIRRKYFG